MTSLFRRFADKWRQTFHPEWIIGDANHCEITEATAAGWVLLRADTPPELLAAAVSELCLLDEDLYFSRYAYAEKIAGHPNMPAASSSAIIEAHLDYAPLASIARSQKKWREAARRDLNPHCGTAHPTCWTRDALDESFTEEERIQALLASERRWREVVQTGALPGMSDPGPPVSDAFLLGVIDHLMPGWLKRTHPDLVGFPPEWVAAVAFSDASLS